MIKVVHVHKIYNKGKASQVDAVIDVNLHIQKGAMVVVRGPSGSGKTSLLTLIGCIARPTSGEIHVAGKTISRLPERFMSLHRRQHVGFIFQHFNLIQDLSVKDNIGLPLYPQGISINQLNHRINDLLLKMRMETRKDFLIKQLSGGEQQRVAIARALINDPDILLADEPTAHLDTALSKELMETIEQIKKEERTIVIASHDPVVYEYPSVDKIYEMRDGRIREG